MRLNISPAYPGPLIIEYIVLNLREWMGLYKDHDQSM